MLPAAAPSRALRAPLARGLFSFVGESPGGREALVARSREALRGLGRPEQRVELHLPFSPSPGGPRGVEPAAASALPKELRALKHTAVVEIRNPASRNALSGKMMAELADAVALLESDRVLRRLSAVALVGAGGWFCAGADLRVAKQALSSREAGAAMGALMVDTLARLRRLPLVSVACVEGGAFGGGAELATACDFRLMHRGAAVQFVQAKMGVSPGWGGGARLYKIVGRQHALRLLCTAEKLSAARALELQLADEVFDGETSAMAATASFLAPFDATAPAVSHGAKRVINNADDVSLDEVMSYEHDVFTTLWGGPANMEALEGALKKKK